MLLFNKKILAVAVALAVSGCANLEPRSVQAKSAVDAKKTEVTKEIQTFGLKRISSPAEIPGGLIERVSERSGYGDINFNANGPLSSLITSLASDYSVSYVTEVNRLKIVSLSIKNLNTEAAIKKIAKAAGYIAIIDGKSITITDEASYTFRIPGRLMTGQTSTYNVGGNPLAAGGSSGGGQGGSSGGGSSGSTLQANFLASGRSSPGSDIPTHIRSIAGSKASVSVSPDTGYITVRSNGVALDRVHKFLNEYVYDGNRRADIKLSIIEVTLGEEYNYGIDWNKALDGLGGALNVALSRGATTVQTPSLSLNYTSASITSIINVLKNKTDVNVLTQPNISAMNRVPSLIVDSTSLPYVGQITSNALQNNVTTTAEASFATDGVSLSLVADITSDSEAQISLLPVITGVQDFQTFNLGALGSIVAPTSANKSALMTALVENGQTVILGGIRISNATINRTAIPGNIPTAKSNKTNAKELVILLQSNVIQPKKIDTLVTESL